MYYLSFFSFLAYFIAFTGFIFACYSVYRISKEQRKKTFLLKKIYEQRGGILLDHEEFFLES